MAAYATGHEKERQEQDNPTVYGRLSSIVEPGKSKYRIAEYGVGKEGYRPDGTPQQQIGIRRPEALFYGVHNGQQGCHGKIYGNEPQDVELVEPAGKYVIIAILQKAAQEIGRSFASCPTVDYKVV